MSVAVTQVSYIGETTQNPEEHQSEECKSQQTLHSEQATKKLKLNHLDVVVEGDVRESYDGQRV